MPATAVKTKLPAIATNIYIECSPERVFQTLTTGAGWDAWFTQGSTIDAKSGGKVQLVWKNFGIHHIDVTDCGRVLKCQTNRLFSFSWHEHLEPTTVTFELEPRGQGCIVHLTDSGYTLENLSAPGGFLDCALGWGEALALLKFYLEHGVVTQCVPAEAN